MLSYVLGHLSETIALSVTYYYKMCICIEKQPINGSMGRSFLSLEFLLFVSLVSGFGHHICPGGHSSSECWQNHVVNMCRRHINRIRGWFWCRYRGIPSPQFAAIWFVVNAPSSYLAGVTACLADSYVARSFRKHPARQGKQAICTRNYIIPASSSTLLCEWQEQRHTCTPAINSSTAVVAGP